MRCVDVCMMLSSVENSHQQEPNRDSTRSGRYNLSNTSLSGSVKETFGTLNPVPGLQALQVLSDDGDRVLCRDWRSEDRARTLLAVFPGTERPAPASLKELAHEYGLRDKIVLPA